jgi:hypothetical protein
MHDLIVRLLALHHHILRFSKRLAQRRDLLALGPAK